MVLFFILYVDDIFSWDWRNRCIDIVVTLENVKEKF